MKKAVENTTESNLTLPFILEEGEVIVCHMESVTYMGVGYSTHTTFGGVAGSHLFGGAASSKQIKTENSIFNSQVSEVYLTNRRLVFVKQTGGIFSGKSRLPFSIIPLTAIEGVTPSKKWFIPTIQLAVNNGQMDLITVQMPKQRDEWVGRISEQVRNSKKSDNKAGGAEQKFCGNCGEKLGQKDKFCPGCGHKQ